MKRPSGGGGGLGGLLDKINKKPKMGTLVSKMSHVTRKLVVRVSDQVRHKPGYTAIENGYRER